MADRIWTIGGILKWTEQYFGGKGIENPRLDAEVLLSYVLQKERIYLYVHFDEPLEAAEMSAFHDLVRRRVQHEPVAYLIGSREFMGLDFAVDPSVLIPRPDTEILVQAAIERLKLTGGVDFADLGTGSGAVCLSVLHYLPATRAVTVDISPAAIEVAKENAASLAVAERVEFRQGDFLTPLRGQEFAAILSNPPYIPDADIAALAPEVRTAEPHLALAGGEDGLDFYRRLVSGAAALLQPGGFAAMEIGIHQADAVVQLAQEHPAWGRVEVLRDLAGLERVVVWWKK